MISIIIICGIILLFLIIQKTTEMFNCDMVCSSELYVFDGKLYLVDHEKIFNSTNPRIFMNYSDYLTYAKANNCDIINQHHIKEFPARFKKSLDLINDPRETYLKQCNKKVAEYMDKAGNEYNSLNSETDRIYNSKLNYKYDNDVEKCMLDLVLREH